VRLTFARDQATQDEIADRVILALPFSLLRDVDLNRSAFRPRKLLAVRELGMGRNTKLQLQFRERAWRRANGNGETRLEGSYLTSWEVTRAQPGDAGILNFFSGGTLAVRAGDRTPEEKAHDALADLERIYPGIGALWNGNVIRNAWDRHPWSRGSYSLLKPLQYTSFHAIEWEPEGAVHFAGEHTSEASSGYLNGAVETGHPAAAEVLASLGLKVTRHMRRAA
jgi:monoamine oxidase